MSKAKTEAPKDAKLTKQPTLMGYFGKPKTGPAPRPFTHTSSQASIPPSSDQLTSSSPASTTLRTPPSNAGSSPLNGAAKMGNGNAQTAKRAGSPLKESMLAMNDSDGELTPPPEISKPLRSEVKESEKVDEDEEMGEAADGSPFVLSRAAKRKKVVYIESDSEGSQSEADLPKPKTTKAGGRKPRKSLKADSDSDEFMIGDDDIAMAAAADAYEAKMFASPSPSAASASPAPRPVPKSQPQIKRQFVPPRPVPRIEASSRPGPRPLGAGESLSASASNSFLLTESERQKIQAKEDRREAESRYSFLVDVKDMDGHRPGDPDYDKRTIFIPKHCWNEFTPFEKQFWQIKQYHYDTVLFFQKGKFYELYEDDAAIGHQEFDLKLTDRVKMKMVGVPEQQFEIWAAKFLAAGHKVGKVEQVETMIGMEMRTKNDSAKSGKEKGGKSDAKIVNRELAQVFTNGTIVDGTYLTSDDANHCVAIKECVPEDPSLPTSFGVCVLDASTGQFDLSSFEDDICRTKLETMFRQIRPKELIHAKGNLSVTTTRLLRNILPMSTLWQSFKDGTEFYSSDQTIIKLGEMFDTESDEAGKKPQLPDAIATMLDNEPAMEALGGMLFYLKSLNLDKDLVSQKNFNIYDPINQGLNLILDGQTLAHMEVLVNNEGGVQGTLLDLLQRCCTPFGKRLFRIWLTKPLLNVADINDRLDAVDDIMSHPNFAGDFANKFSKIPDLERLVSRIHAGSLRESDFLKVMDWYKKVQEGLDSLSHSAESFASSSVRGLLRTAPDLTPHLNDMDARFKVDREEKSIAILPQSGADEDCDDADAEVDRIDEKLNTILSALKRQNNLKDAIYWHSSLGLKEIYQIQVPADSKVPKSWTKMASNKKHARYVTPETAPVIREMQEARETQNTAKKTFYKRLLKEFDVDRVTWLKSVQVIAELDCLVSLAKASITMDEPKCRPEFIDSPKAFIDFQELRHPSMCLRGQFIDNDVKLGGVPQGDDGNGEEPRTVLLTGPNMAGKSTLLRMTAAGVIMAQMGCYVPASSARLSPIDKIQTRMGAYDNMFASASTFKVELDECSKILRQAGPRSLVILDELGRGTSTYDGMAIAGAVLHHLATHTLPLGFFATHYGSLTDDFDYHPNIRNMHMQTHVDEARREVIFLYKLIPGIAKSSYGTHVAHLAGVPKSVVARAEKVSLEFQETFKEKLAGRRQSSIPLVAQADFSWLMKLVEGKVGGGELADVYEQLGVIRRAIGRYDLGL